jgi:hypothetical protein
MVIISARNEVPVPDEVAVVGETEGEGDGLE